MSQNQDIEPVTQSQEVEPVTQSQGVEPVAQMQPLNRRVGKATVTALVMSRALQPIGSLDAVNARVPGFEDITDQPDWGGHGFSGRKSDVRVVRFDRVAATEQSEGDAPTA